MRISIRYFLTFICVCKHCVILNGIYIVTIIVICAKRNISGRNCTVMTFFNQLVCERKNNSLNEKSQGY